MMNSLTHQTDFHDLHFAAQAHGEGAVGAGGGGRWGGVEDSWEDSRHGDKTAIPLKGITMTV